MPLQNYTIVKTLGKGGFAQVYQVTSQGKTYALKKISNLKSQHPRLKEYFDRQISTQKKMDHPNIVKLLQARQSSDQILILVQYCSQSVFDILKKQQRLNLQKAIKILKDVIHGLAAVHKKGFIHRDIKLQNVLEGLDGRYKLADFGLTKGIQNSDTVLGSADYMAPQIDGKQNYSYSVDIWSLGVFFFFLIFGQRPFANRLDVKNKCYPFKFSDFPNLKNNPYYTNAKVEQFFKQIFVVDKHIRNDLCGLINLPLLKQHFTDREIKEFQKIYRVSISSQVMNKGQYEQYQVYRVKFLIENLKFLMENLNIEPNLKKLFQFQASKAILAICEEDQYKQVKTSLYTCRQLATKLVEQKFRNTNRIDLQKLQIPLYQKLQFPYKVLEKTKGDSQFCTVVNFNKVKVMMRIISKKVIDILMNKIKSVKDKNEKLKINKYIIRVFLFHTANIIFRSENKIKYFQGNIEKWISDADNNMIIKTVKQFHYQFFQKK